MICLVINNETNEQINSIVADSNDPPPDGCRLVELISDMYWDGVQLTQIPEVVNGD